MLETAHLLAHRGQATPSHQARPCAYEVTAPRTLFSWDITYVPSSLLGQYYYVYLFVDVFSRKAVGAEVHAEESREHSSRLLDTILPRGGRREASGVRVCGHRGADERRDPAGAPAAAGRQALVPSPVGQQ